MKKKVRIIMALYLTLSMMLSLSACGGDDSVEVNATPVSVEQTEATTEATTEEMTTEPFVATTINIKMVGDMLMHAGLTESGRNADGTYNFDHLFVNVKDDIQSADIAIVNQEVMLGGYELGVTGYPSFNTVFELGDALVNAGFNVVLHATNHTIDKGAVAVDNCLNYWKTNHPEIAVLGINATAEDAENIYVYEQGDIKVAILNYTYGTNGISLPEGREYLVNLLDKERVVKDLQKANELADFIIVCPHWGAEYQYTPYDGADSVYDQVNWAQLFADNGADLILGAHPHVIEPVEWIEGADGNRTLCYYSVGNFVSRQATAATMVGAMADVTIENNENGEVYIKDYGVIPLVTQKSGDGYVYHGDTTYKLSDYTEELAASNYIRVQDATFSLQFCKDLCRQVFGNLYTEE